MALYVVTCSAVYYQEFTIEADDEDAAVDEAMEKMFEAHPTAEQIEVEDCELADEDMHIDIT